MGSSSLINWVCKNVSRQKICVWRDASQLGSRKRIYLKRAGRAYVLAYMALSVVSTLFTVQPTPGALLLADCDPAANYTLSLANEVFAYMNTIPSSAAASILPIPSNYLGELYLAAVQYGISSVETYTVSVAQAAYHVRGNPGRRPMKTSIIFALSTNLQDNVVSFLHE
jgi:hypothetical protein